MFFFVFFNLNKKFKLKNKYSVLFLVTFLFFLNSKILFSMLLDTKHLFLCGTLFYPNNTKEFLQTQTFYSKKINICLSMQFFKLFYKHISKNSLK